MFYNKTMNLQILSNEIQSTPATFTAIELIDILRILFLSLWIVFAGLLLISCIIDRRRFRNSIYLLLMILNLLGYGLCATAYTPSGPYMILVALLFGFFLFLIVPGFLIVNGFIVLHREGRHLSNFMSLAFGIFILLGEWALVYSASHVTTSANRILIFFIGIFIFYNCVICLAFITYSLVQSWIPRKSTFDYVIVHGAGLIHGDQVSHLLAERIDKGIEVYNRSLSSCRLICSGGQGGDETKSEAEAMKQYMIDHGVPARDILVEQSSVSTIENLRNSINIINHRDGRKRIALVTSNYHVLRAVIYARKLGIACTGIGSHVAFYYWPSAMIREYVALMKQYLVPWICGLIVIEIPCWLLIISMLQH